MIEEDSLPSREANNLATTELQCHMEHLFRKAGDSPEVKRLRLSILNYRLSASQKTEGTQEQAE